jgi:hypothetical protein
MKPAAAIRIIRTNFTKAAVFEKRSENIFYE